MPELLAPAGNTESLKAAVYAGADAVYFGLPDLNARKNAKNIGYDELDLVFEICRVYGVKIYIALNTLCSRRELGIAFDMVDRMEAGNRPDAYIIQDLGLAGGLKEKYPYITMHASTQMCVHNSFGAKILKNAGFSRAVLARELSGKDICSFNKKSGMESEVFVHGALCVSQSGGCLMSYMLGGRSGNRGECAYPCRLPYNGGASPLSLKDLCLAGHIPELINLGVASFKVEGRMKSPEYVYSVISVYRKLIDENRAATKKEIEFLKNVFSRDGFTDGYYTGVSSGMLGTRGQEDKERTRRLDIKITEKKIPVDIKGIFITGKETELKLSAGGCGITVRGIRTEKAETAPLDRNIIEKQLCRLGNTYFEPGKIDTILSDEAFIKVSDINSLRREGVKKLTEEILKQNEPPCADQLPGIMTKGTQNEYDPGIIVRYEGNCISVKELENVARIDLPLWKPELWMKLLGFYEKLCLVLPRTVFDTQEEKLFNMLESAKKAGITKLLIPNISYIPLGGGFELHGDFTLNCINDNTLGYLYGLGLKTVVVSPEAPLSLGNSRICYGRLPLMHTNICVIKNLVGCKNETECRGELRDRTGVGFPVYREFEHTNIIYNSVKTYLFDKMPENIKMPYIIFTDENEEQQKEVINSCNKRTAPSIEFTRK